MVWTGGWGDTESDAGRDAITDQAIAFMREAGGIPAIVMMGFAPYASVGPNHLAYRGHEASQALLRRVFTKLRDAGLASRVAALYPVDEPELYQLDATDVCNANADIRSVLAEFPEMHAKLAVIYSADLSQLPGIDCYDVAGFDQYQLGGDIFKPGGSYELFLSHLRPDQKTLLIMGGSDPWRTDPARFEQEAMDDDRVYALVGFVWWDHWDADHSEWRGIRSSGMACAYRATAQRIQGNTPATCEGTK